MLDNQPFHKALAAADDDLDRGQSPLRRAPDCSFQNRVEHLYCNHLVCNTWQCLLRQSWCESHPEESSVSDGINCFLIHFGLLADKRFDQTLVDKQCMRHICGQKWSIFLRDMVDWRLREIHHTRNTESRPQSISQQSKEHPRQSRPTSETSPLWLSRERWGATDSHNTHSF